MTEASPFALLEGLVERFETLSIDYAVGGSLASSAFGTPRATHDIDVLVRLDADGLERLAEALRGSWYVPVEAARRAVVASSSFNVLHEATGLKVDLFVAGDGGLDRAQLTTSVATTLHPGGRPVRVTAPAVLVVRKLAWYRSGGEVSDRQWRDVLGVLARHRADLVEVARELAGAEGLGDLLERALAEAAGADD